MLTISGDDRYVADYLYRESLMQLPEGVQRFLRRTAVLDQLSCSAVRRDPRRVRCGRRSFATWRRRACSWSRWTAGAGGIATTRCSGSSCSAELQRVEPDVIAKLHLRAADWYESNGSPALALEHLLNTTERDRCVQLVTELVLPTYQSGQLSTVQRWLSTLGDSAVEEYPPLAVLAGWIAVLTGQTADAQRWAAFARHRLVRPDAGGRHRIVRLGAGHVAGCSCVRAGPEQMATDASLAVAEEPPWSPWRAMALVLVRRGAAAPRRQ